MPSPFPALMTSAVLAVGVCLTPGAQAQRATMNTPAAPALDRADQKVAVELARANIAEIESARLALTRARNPQVKAYARQMIDDHTRALNDIRALAQDKGVTVPAVADARDKAHARLLGKLDGARFDQAYMAHSGVREHTRLQAALEKHHARVKDQDLKAFIAKMIPTIEQHLHRATELQAGAGGAAR